MRVTRVVKRHGQVIAYVILTVAASVAIAFVHADAKDNGTRCAIVGFIDTVVDNAARNGQALHKTPSASDAQRDVAATNLAALQDVKREAVRKFGHPHGRACSSAG